MDARVKPLLYMLFYAEYRFDLYRLRMAIINNLKVPNVNVSEFTAISMVETFAFVHAIISYRSVTFLEIT